MYYIVGRLKDGQNFDMLVFSEIIKNMTGIEIIRDVSDSGMMLSSSGPYLRSTSNTLSASAFGWGCELLQDQKDSLVLC